VRNRVPEIKGGIWIEGDCLCGLVVRVPGYRPRGPAFDARRYNIKMDLKGIGWSGMGWSDLAQDSSHWKGCYEYGNEPLGSIKYSEIFA
jgi:hypothetical protein